MIANQLAIMDGQFLIGPYMEEERKQAITFMEAIRKTRKTKKAQKKRLEIVTLLDPFLAQQLYDGPPRKN